MSFDALIQSYIGVEKNYLVDPITGEVLAYSNLAAESDRLYEILKTSGFQEGSHVAIALTNGITAVAAILTVLRFHGVVIPVNLGWKQDEFRYILENSEADLLISREDVLQDAGVAEPELAAEYRDARIYRLTAVEHDPVEESHEGQPLSLLLYTSGTTGKPKGVKLTEAALLAEMRFIAEGHGLTESDTAMSILPCFHINGLVIGILTPFLVKETLVIPPKFSVSHFWEWVEQYEVRWVSGVPTILSMILARTPRDYTGARCMRFFRSASAPLPEAVQQEFEGRFEIPIVESFGISEGASQIASNPVDGVHKLGSAGLAQGNEMRITDEHGNVLPDGETGEISVKGPNLFYGYFHKPRETEESLKDGWFYTGDLGYRDSDGYFFLNGRKKELINRAGEKFSPREIDEVLYGIEGIELAAAVGVPDPLYNEEVVAYVKLREGITRSEEEILSACKGKLADFKLPKRIFFTDDFPKGPSGKIQRLKLRDRYMQKA